MFTVVLLGPQTSTKTMMRSILVLLGLSAVAFACEDGWESFGESCYKFDNTDRNYADSEAFCLEQGGHLVSIHSDDENIFVGDKARELSMGNTWIGLDDNDEENVFSYLDGTPFYRGGFTRGEPNNWGGNQDCSYFPFRGTYGWDDMRCSNQASPLCERNGPCPEEWIVREETGNCYKWFTDRMSYDQAKARCLENGAYLVSITTPEENRFVIDDVAIATSGEENGPQTWIGLDDETTEGYWTLVDPESTDFLGRFSRGEPNNAGSGQNCAWFPFREAYKWDDVSCNANRKAVCKKPNPEHLFGDLTEKTKSIVVALYSGCINTEIQDDQNLCEKLEGIFDELVGDEDEEE
ncbi:sperm receptor for egg jelly-like [Anneissia japonica]|uniref:sperm receptor for egg jelly-like n=1 Tax=Anneissia japonica TaxID=1529436 RepID=UPI0014255760|nr:sperm receptor for egg jelly-like [Anneissia japonica]